jgi:catechol 2,3-dioxygenase-like lactoylglutathione lyase family enzyme
LAGLIATIALMTIGPAAAQAATVEFHHVHITTSSPLEGVRWYVERMDCQAVPDRADTAKCGNVELIFVAQPTMGSSQGTGIDHISFSFADLTAKMAALERVGVQGSGVRFQRYPDGATIHDLPGLFKAGFIFDPWGTRIEMVQDPERLGFHHVHLSAADPAATLAWYRTALGGEATTLKGQITGVRVGTLLVLAQKHPQGAPANSRGRSIDHLGFMVADVDDAIGGLRTKNVAVLEQPSVPENARTPAKRSLVAAPDNVRLELVATGFAGVKFERGAAAVAESRAPYTAPRTPWGTPDLQGLYTGNTAHGIPLQKPVNLADAKALSPEQAAARRERSTLGSIWGYEREWRDTTLEYQKRAPSTQVAMVVDPPDGRLPPMTTEGRRQAQEAVQRERAGAEDTDLERLPAGPEDLGNFVRCITRGVPGNMIPGVYNNGLQIVQGPGYVVIEKEMIHEARIIPTDPRPRRSASLKTYLGDSLGHWDGDTLVVETANFNGKSSYQGASANMKLTERFTRIGPTQLEYRFTIDDPAIWTKPWTAMFVFDKDDDQYELVEYACHEANYGMTNILAGARVTEKARTKKATTASKK